MIGCSHVRDITAQRCQHSIQDLQGGTTIQRAVDAGNEEVFRLLLRNHADSSVVDGYQIGLLHSAAING